MTKRALNDQTNVKNQSEEKKIAKDYIVEIDLNHFVVIVLLICNKYMKQHCCFITNYSSKIITLKHYLSDW